MTTLLTNYPPAEVLDVFEDPATVQGGSLSDALEDQVCTKAYAGGEHKTATGNAKPCKF